jgi:hypothetical protein
MCILWKANDCSVCCRPFELFFLVLYFCCIAQREYLLSINIKDIFRACQTGEPWLCPRLRVHSQKLRCPCERCISDWIFTSTPLACVYSRPGRFVLRLRKRDGSFLCLEDFWAEGLSYPRLQTWSFCCCSVFFNGDISHIRFRLQSYVRVWDRSCILWNLVCLLRKRR